MEYWMIGLTIVLVLALIWIGIVHFIVNCEVDTLTSRLNNMKREPELRAEIERYEDLGGVRGRYTIGRLWSSGKLFIWSSDEGEYYSIEGFRSRVILPLVIEEGGE